MTSDTTENNLERSGTDGGNTSSPRLGESTCHILPCNVDYEGMANTHVYFKPVQIEDGVLASSFRGRGLLAMQEEYLDDSESREGYPVLLSVEDDQIQAKMAISNFVEWHHEHSIKSLKFKENESSRVHAAKEWMEISNSVRLVTKMSFCCSSTFIVILLHSRKCCILTVIFFTVFSPQIPLIKIVA